MVKPTVPGSKLLLLLSGGAEASLFSFGLDRKIFPLPAITAWQRDAGGQCRARSGGREGYIRESERAYLRRCAARR
eukprot:2388129-Rhodomonas_salina.1